MTTSPVALASRLSAIISDTIVVAITWKKTFHVHKQASRLGIRTSISSTLLKDGERW